MDVYQFACNQFGKWIASGAVRIWNPETNSVVQEKGSAALMSSFPDLTREQVREHVNQCVSTGKPLLNLIYAKGHLLLLLEATLQTQSGHLLLEALIDGTDQTFLNMSDLDERAKLICELDRLNRQNTTDVLTGLYNRRYIDDHLPSDILNCIIQKQPLSIIFADLDYYKKVNDAYGHAAGDFVLKGLAEIFIQNTRKEIDWVARYGGEEFLIFLHNCQKKKAKDIAERIRIAVMNHTFQYNKQGIHITCSFGVITIDDFSVIPSTDEILDTVDKRLYQAKQLGRNVVI